MLIKRMTQEHVLELKKVNNMTNEEKAKAYDKAIERVRGMYKEGLWNARIEYIFPELKESEDERIRKLLIDIVKVNSCGRVLKDIDKSEYQNCLAWLEKQEEKKSTWKPSEYDISLLEEIAKKTRYDVRPFCSEVSALEDLIRNLKNLLRK